jgi:hypothetical protein
VLKENENTFSPDPAGHKGGECGQNRNIINKDKVMLTHKCLQIYGSYNFLKPPEYDINMSERIIKKYFF